MTKETDAGPKPNKGKAQNTHTTQPRKVFTFTEPAAMVSTSITTNAALYREFKTLCTKRGVKIKDAIEELILQYVQDEIEKPAAK